MIKKNKFNPVSLFIVLYLLCILQSLIFSYIYKDNFFNMASYLRWAGKLGGDYFPLLDRHIFSPIYPNHPYPPLSYLLYYFLSRISCIRNGECYNVFSLMVFYFFITIPVFATFLIIQKKLLEIKFKNIFIILLILSYEILGAMAYGNLSILTTPFVTYFCFYYDSDIKYKKELSIFFMSFVIALKIQPFLLIGIYLIDKKYKDFIKCLIYTAILCFIPLLFFRNGNSYFENLFLIVEQFIGYTNYTPGYYGGGMIIIYIFSIINKLLHLNVNLNLCANIYSKILLLMVLYFVFFANKKWKKLTLLIYGSMLIGAQYSHSGVIFIIPFVIYLIEEKFIIKNIFVFVCFVMTILPYRVLILSNWLDTDESFMHTAVLEIFVNLIIIYVLFDCFTLFLHKNKKIIC